MIFLLPLLACSSPAPDCPECPDHKETESSAPQGSAQMSPWEAELLAEPLAEIRQGIQPFNEESIGVCTGVQKCEAYLGAEPGLLGEGDHMVFAELRVPSYGENWKANFELHCETSRPDGSSTPYDYDRSYEVRNSGPNRGYRLSPMMRIKSPHSSGPRSCTYSLTPIRPDGEAGEAWTGSYQTP